MSGPMHGDHDPFASRDADLGFLCSLSFLYLPEQATPSIELVPAAFVFHDQYVFCGQSALSALCDRNHRPEI